MIEYINENTVVLKPNPPKRQPRYIKVVRKKPQKSNFQKELEDQLSSTVRATLAGEVFLAKQLNRSKKYFEDYQGYLQGKPMPYRTASKYTKVLVPR